MVRSPLRSGDRNARRVRQLRSGPAVRKYYDVRSSKLLVPPSKLGQSAGTVLHTASISKVQRRGAIAGNPKLQLKAFITRTVER